MVDALRYAFLIESNATITNTTERAVHSIKAKKLRVKKALKGDKPDELLNAGLGTKLRIGETVCKPAKSEKFAAQIRPGVLRRLKKLEAPDEDKSLSMSDDKMPSLSVIKKRLRDIL